MSLISFDKFPPDNLATATEQPAIPTDEVWEAIESMAQSESDDIFAQFEAEPDLAVPPQPAEPGMCAVCVVVIVNRNSPVLPDGRKVCKKCQLVELKGMSPTDPRPAAGDGTDSREQVAEFDVPAEPVNIYEGEDQPQESEASHDQTPAETGEAQLGAESQSVTESDSAPVVPLHEQIGKVVDFLKIGMRIEATKCAVETFGFTLKEAYQYIENLERTEPALQRLPEPDAPGQRQEPPSEPVRTDAGVIDPETGEILEPSFILRKLGWSEMPKISKDPSEAELQAFEAKLDQIGERIAGHQEKTGRWRAATEKRCEPFDKAAEFWTTQFLEPMAKQLAPHRLPTYQSGANIGDYSKKTFYLPFGGIKFTQSGGAYVHDAEMLKQYIAKEGVKNFAAIGAKETVAYSHQKLMTALNNGTLKDLPGTGVKAKDPLAKVSIVVPGSKETKESEDINE